LQRIKVFGIVHYDIVGFHNDDLLSTYPCSDKILHHFERPGCFGLALKLHQVLHGDFLSPQRGSLDQL
jgi:hypothetical protein